MSSEHAAANAETDLAMQSLRQGDVEGARKHALRAIAACPTLARARAAMGTIELVCGNADAAGTHLREATTLAPTFAEAHLNLAAALAAGGDIDAGWQALTTAVQLAPELDAGAVAARLLAAAREGFERSPDDDNALRLLRILSGLGMMEQAVDLARRLCDAAPDDADRVALLGDTLRRAGRADEAAQAAERAHRLAPTDPAHLGNAAAILLEAGRRADGERLARRAVDAHPQAARPLFLLASLLHDQGRKAEARPLFLAAAEAPDATATELGRGWFEAAQAVDWQAEARLLPRLRAGLGDGSDAANPFHLVLAPLEPQLLRRNAEAFCARKWPRRRPLAGAAMAKPRLRVGYLSPDYRDHPITHLVADLFRHHDRNRFEVMLYGLGAEDGGAAGRAIRGLADGCTWVGQMSDMDAARRIRDDGIDILIDLAGHTKGNGLGTLSYRPAPVQLHYLGFPGTTGAPFVDYFVGDPTSVPVEAESEFSEKIIRLPLTYQVNSTRPALAPAERERWGFAATDVVFCSFNHIRKLTAEVFDAWCRILAEVPNGLLWLLADDDSQIPALGRHAQARGIAPDRLRFAPRLPRDEHLRRMAAADLHLDSFPYNAHTTASDSLWAGVPVLTARDGATFAARVSVGLLRAAGLEDCIADDLDGMARLAIALGNDRPALERLKARTRAAHTSPLFDALGFTRTFERGLEQAWRRAVDGLPPAAIDLTGA